MRYRWVCFSPSQPDTVSLCAVWSRTRQVYYWSELGRLIRGTQFSSTGFAQERHWCERSSEAFKQVLSNMIPDSATVGQERNGTFFYFLCLALDSTAFSSNPAIQHHCISMVMKLWRWSAFFPFLFVLNTCKNLKRTWILTWFPKVPSVAFQKP